MPLKKNLALKEEKHTEKHTGKHVFVYLFILSQEGAHLWIDDFELKQINGAIIQKLHCHFSAEFLMKKKKSAPFSCFCSICLFIFHHLKIKRQISEI